MNPPEQIFKKQFKRTGLEQRIDVLRVIYQGAYNTTRIGQAAGLNHVQTKKILFSLVNKRYIALVPRGLKGKSRRHNHPNEDGHRKWSWLSIVITQDGIKVLTAARTLTRQLLDEEIDWR